MVIDPELLKRAQEAATRLAEAERQLLLARAEYHTSVRRLHLSQSSLREVAQALGLSHQRVQQIVQGAGGSWWSRVWRSRQVKRDAVCTFCERPPSEVAKLIAGPDVYICDACVGLAEQSIGDGRTTMQGEIKLGRARGRASCSFCGKPQTRDRPVASGPASGVCVECLVLCRQILNDRGG